MEDIEGNCEIITIPCTSNVLPLSHSFRWSDEAPRRFKYLLVCRSRFDRRLKTSVSLDGLPTTAHPQTSSLTSPWKMKQGGADHSPGGVGSAGRAQITVDGAAAGDPDQFSPERTVGNEVGGAHRQVQRAGGDDSAQTNPGASDEADPVATRGTTLARCLSTTWSGQRRSARRTRTTSRTWLGLPSGQHHT